MPIFEVRLTLSQPDPTFAFSARGMIDALDSLLQKQSSGRCHGHATDSLMIAQISAPALEAFQELIDSYANKQRRRSPHLTVSQTLPARIRCY